MPSLSPIAKQRFFDSNGDPLAGGKLWTYAAGTTAPVATKLDKAGTLNTNPIILDANGECTIWLVSGLSYKYVLLDANDVPQWTEDNIETIDTSEVVTELEGELAVFVDAAEDAAIAAQLAETNAETAETNAELAETNAETAQGLAEAARDAALAAQLAAETAETNAELAETNAETAATNSENSNLASAANAAAALSSANLAFGYLTSAENSADDAAQSVIDASAVLASAILTDSDAKLGSLLVGTGIKAASAAFEIQSTTKGRLGPKMNESQRDAIVAPAIGLEIFNTTSDQYETYTTSGWQAPGGGGVSTHAGLTTTHGVTGDIVGTGGAQDLSNKTFSGLGTDTISEKTTNAGVTVDGVLLKDSQVNTDQINEKTATAGVTIDGVLLKDSQVTTDVINEKTATAGVTADGVLLKDSQVSTDQINEKTAAAGVTIDSVLLKDGEVKASGAYIGAGTKNASAAHEVDSTTKGVLDPRMTTAQRDAISTPATGLRIFNITSNQPEVYKSGSWQGLGSGTGTGGVNYLAAYNGEDATGGVTGWNGYKDTAGILPVDGTGGSVTAGHTFTADATDPLYELKSLLVTKPASNCQGEGFSCDFTLARGHRNMPLFLSGLVEAGATYVVDTYVFALVNVTSGAVSQLKGSISGNRITLRGETDSNTSYRLCIHCAGTSAVAMTIKFDSLKFGPESVVDQGIDTFWGNYAVNPLGGGTATYTSSKQSIWRQTSLAKIDFEFTVNNVGNGASTVYITIPAGMTVDTTKALTMGQLYTNAGTLSASNLSCYFSGNVIVMAANETLVVGTDLAAGSGFYGSLTVPILEWANQSAVLSTTEMMNQVLGARYYVNVTTAVTASATVIDFNGKSFDDGNRVTTGAAWKYTSNKIADLLVNVNLDMASATGWALNERIILDIYKNGSHYGQLDVYRFPSSDGTASSLYTKLQGTSLVRMNPNDYIQILVRQDSGANINVSTGETYSYIEIKEFPVYSTLGVYEDDGRVTVTSAASPYTITAAYPMIFVDTSGGAVTLNMPSPAVRRKIKIKDSTGNFATNACTLVPSGSEKIEGLAANLVLSASWGNYEFQTNGVDWFKVSGASNMALMTLTSSSTWTCPAGVTVVTATGRGGASGGCGGGAGGGGSTAAGAAGGGGGASGSGVISQERKLVVVPGTAYTMTVGSGGAGGPGGTPAAANAAGSTGGDGTDGSAGGTTSFGSLWTWTSGASQGAGTGGQFTTVGAAGSFGSAGSRMVNGCAGGAGGLKATAGANAGTPGQVIYSNGRKSAGSGGASGGTNGGGGGGGGSGQSPAEGSPGGGTGVTGGAGGASGSNGSNGINAAGGKQTNGNGGIGGSGGGGGGMKATTGSQGGEGGDGSDGSDGYLTWVWQE
jgi:hypothetical protein